jgi:hypothetical protein
MTVVVDSFGCFHSPLHGKRLHFATRRHRPSARCNSALAGASTSTVAAFFVGPARLLRRHRELVARRRTYPDNWPGRPFTAG